MAKLRVGLTGTIGCGKTTVANMLRSLGVAVIDVDQAGRFVVENNQEVISMIRETFGEEFFDDNGKFDRVKMGNIVFSNEQHLATFNEIVHPAMIQRVKDEIDRVLNNMPKTPYIVVDAALIFELNMDTFLDYVVTVAAPLEICLQRTHLRDSLSREQILQRIHAQMPLAEKMQISDYVIKNTGTLDDLRLQVERLHARLLEKTKVKWS